MCLCKDIFRSPSSNRLPSRSRRNQSLLWDTPLRKPPASNQGRRGFSTLHSLPTSPPFPFLCPHLRSRWAASRVNQNCRHRAAPAGLDLQVTDHGIGGRPAAVKRRAGRPAILSERLVASRSEAVWRWRLGAGGSEWALWQAVPTAAGPEPRVEPSTSDRRRGRAHTGAGGQVGRCGGPDAVRTPSGVGSNQRYGSVLHGQTTRAAAAAPSWCAPTLGPTTGTGTAGRRPAPRPRNRGGSRTRRAPAGTDHPPVQRSGAGRTPAGLVAPVQFSAGWIVIVSGCATCRSVAPACSG